MTLSSVYKLSIPIQSVLDIVKKYSSILELKDSHFSIIINNINDIIKLIESSFIGMIKI